MDTEQTQQLLEKMTQAFSPYIDHLQYHSVSITLNSFPSKKEIEVSLYGFDGLTSYIGTAETFEEALQEFKQKKK